LTVTPDPIGGSGLIGGSGNLISGNLNSGVQIAQGNNNSIEGNFIGTDATGEFALGNDPTGVFDGVDVLIGFGNFIGGVSKVDANGNLSGFGNLISGNIGQDPTQGAASAGVFIEAGGGGFAAPGTTVDGNFIGTDVTGTRALGNASDGVFVFFSTGNFIGGSAKGTGNVISANGGDGIILFGQNASQNVVSGNFIGTNASGTASLGNAFWGIELADAANDAIGGTSSGAGNVVSGNEQGGVAVYGQDASGNAIQGNLIGTDSWVHSPWATHLAASTSATPPNSIQVSMDPPPTIPSGD
jgi:titin